jgi:cold shock CspA family protein
MQKGTVCFFNDVRGFGFIRTEDGMQDIFFHISHVEGHQAAVGMPVQFEVAPGPKLDKKPQAVKIKSLEPIIAAVPEAV